MISLSPSHFYTLQQCPRCFWHQYKGKKRPNGPFPSITNGIDRIMKEYSDLMRISKRTAMFLPDGYTLAPDLEIIRRLRTDKGALTFYDGDYRLQGFIDDLLLHIDDEGDGKYAVIDFKSKGHEPGDKYHDSYASQLALYSLLLDQNGFEMHDKAVLLYVYPNFIIDDIDMDKFSVDMGHKAVELDITPQMGMDIFKHAQSILDADHPPEGTEGCQFCEYRDGQVK